MKLLQAAALALSSATMAHAGCNGPVEVQIEEAMKLSFSGFDPIVRRILNTGVGNKIVLKEFDREPIVNVNDGVISVSAGATCEDSTAAPMDSAAMLAVGLPFLFGHSTAGVIGSSLMGLALMGRSSNAQSTSECEIVPIEVDIYVDAMADEIVMRDAQSGDFEVCPPESVYWKHHPEVYGGYEGCSSELGYYPCPQDAHGLEDEEGLFASMFPYKWDGAECVPTGYTMENQTFWVLWGDPSDKHELNKRTGLNPVVSFPFNRGPYPAYEPGVDISEALDDSSDARAMAKDLLVYLGGFTEAELVDWSVTMTEGAESGMIYIWAAKALEIARTTCNRDIYAFVEVPCYGYNNEDSADIANKFASSFYNSSECDCYETDSCLDPTITITSVGWLPGTDLPNVTGGDGTLYFVDSASPASPWFESMVFPENPTGKLKTSQIGNPERLVCDGVYLWPMYFGMEGYAIPIDMRPDCSAWSFSITKAYSASVRAGFIMYRKDFEANHLAMVDAITTSYSMTNGLYSEWSWYGQMQLWEMIMGREVDDPTSWIGAYTSLMDEKWDYIIDGFADCPVATVSNPKAGAYVWFVYQEPFLGIQDGFISSWFRDVLGVQATTYNWGFRGADPADFFGENYTTYDFTRLQLYRDVNVYKEIGRRAKIACSSAAEPLGDFVTTEQWRTADIVTRQRRLSQAYETTEDRQRHLLDAVPDLTERQAARLAKSHEESDKIDQKVAACSPHYSSSCLFGAVGKNHKDY